MRRGSMVIAGLVLVTSALRADDPGSIAGIHDHSGGEWSVSVGLAPLSFPSYAGSGTNRFFLFPLVDVFYKNRVYVGSSRLGVGLGQGIGAYLVHGRVGWTVDLDVTDRRREDRAPVLADLGDRPPGLIAGTSVYARTGPFKATLGLAHYLNGGGGTLGILRLELAGDLGEDGWFGSVAASTRYSDARNLAYDFGITDAQAQARARDGAARLAPDQIGPYQPEAGFRDVSIQSALGRRLGPSWRLFAFGSVTAYQGSAKASPLVQSATGTIAGLGFTYHF